METFYEKGKKYNCRVKDKPYFRTSITINGKRYQVYGDGEKDAKKKIEDMKAEAAAGFNLDHRTAKLNEVFSYWLYNVKRVDKNIKASSFYRYDSAYRTHIAPYPIAQSKLSKLTSAVMQAYVTSLYEEHGVSGASVQATAKVWKMFTKWAVDEGYLAKDPCRNLSLPGRYEQKKVIEVFTEAERKKLIEYMEETNYQYTVLIKLAFATGMRQGELLGLKWSDIHDHAIHIERSTGVVSHVDKNGHRERYREVWDTKTANSVRQIPTLPSTEKMLAEHKLAQTKEYMAKGYGKPEYVFTTIFGKMIDSSSLIASYHRVLKRAGVTIRKFHSIRHTFATEAIRRGVDVKDLQMIMGHSDLQTTYIYVQVNEESKRNAIELMGEII